MIYKNIAFKADPFSYDLVFDDRITLVGGDSGTGKTVLYEILEDLRLTDGYKRIKLFNYKSDKFLESNIIPGTIRSDSNHSASCILDPVCPAYKTKLSKI